MKQLKIQLPTTRDKFHEQILQFFNFAMDLTPQESKILAEFIKLNNEYEALEEHKRAKFIFSSDTRKYIRNKFNVTQHNLNNIIHRLKKKTFFNSPILSEDNIINKALMFKYYSEGFAISFEFIEENTKEIVPVVNKPEEPSKSAQESVTDKLFDSKEENTNEETWFRLKSYSDIFVKLDKDTNQWIDSEGNLFPRKLEIEKIQ